MAVFPGYTLISGGRIICKCMTYYSMQNDATDAFLNTILTDLSAGDHDVSTLLAFVQWLNDVNYHRLKPVACGGHVTVSI